MRKSAASVEFKMCALCVARVCIVVKGGVGTLGVRVAGHLIASGPLGTPRSQVATSCGSFGDPTFQTLFYALLWAH